MVGSSSRAQHRLPRQRARGGGRGEQRGRGRRGGQSCARYCVLVSHSRHDLRRSTEAPKETGRQTKQKASQARTAKTTLCWTQLLPLSSSISLLTFSLPLTFSYLLRLPQLVLIDLIRKVVVVKIVIAIRVVSNLRGRRGRGGSSGGRSKDRSRGVCESSDNGGKGRNRRLHRIGKKPKNGPLILLS